MPLASPTLLTSFEGQSFDSDGGLISGPIPPDPGVAVGSQFVVTTTNGSVEVRAKDGTLVSSESYQDLFGQPSFPFFDPRIVYDPVSNRFELAVLSNVPDTVHPTNPAFPTVWLAVSNDADPRDGWRTENTIFFDPSGPVFVDFTTLGTAGGTVIVGANLFDQATEAFVGSRVWVDAGAGNLFSSFDPSAATGLGTELAALVPAKLFGTPPAGTTDFLVTRNSTNTITVIRVASDLSFTRQTIGVGAIDGGNGGEMTAAQLGGAMPIDVGDGRVGDAVWRNGFLYVVTTVLSQRPGNVGLPEVHWFKFDTSNPAAITIVEQGEVDGSAIAPGTATFDGSIAVNDRGSFVINFAASGPGIHPGAYYAMHLAGDAPGTLETPQALAVGQDSYVRTFGSGVNRWGDFSTAVVDPANPRAFWLVGEYAQTQGDFDPATGEAGRWGTRIGEVFDDHAPTIAGLNASVNGPTTIAATSLFQASDVDAGDTITQYELWDPIAGDGNFTINGVAQAARQVIDVSSLAGLGWDTTDQVGSTVMAVRAFDGLAWSDWTTVTVTNTEIPPEVHVFPGIAHAGLAIPSFDLFLASSGSGGPVTRYELWDPIAGDGGFTINGQAQPARQVISASPLDSIAWDTTGQSGTTVFAVRATDGIAFSDWATVTVTAGNRAPFLANIAGIAHAGQPIPAARMIDATDPDDDPIVGYELWDPIAGDGGFKINGVAQSARQVISVSAADFANLAWDTTGQSGSTVFAVRATDGTDFGDWTVLTVNTTDAPPIVAGFDPVPTATAAQPVIPATSIFEGSVPFGGDTITQYELWDPVAGDGQFVLAGAPQPARQVIDVAAADLADLSWDATDQTGRAVFAVRDFDGFVWSDWTVLAVDKVAQALAASATTPPSLGMGSLLGQGDTVSPTLAASIH